LKVTGLVIGPSFELTPSTLDFGAVAFGFDTTLHTVLENKSDIPLVYDLSSDLDIISFQPSSHCIAPYDTQRIEVTIRPEQVQKYESHIKLGIEHVGDNVLEIPLHAIALVPEVSIPKEITYYSDLKLCNRSCVERNILILAKSS